MRRVGYTPEIRVNVKCRRLRVAPVLLSIALAFLIVCLYELVEELFSRVYCGRFFPQILHLEIPPSRLYLKSFHRTILIIFR